MTGWAPWSVTHKGDVRCRLLADRHYTRQSPGNPRWTRPGYSAVLYAADDQGEAVWVWWRPKWEDGRPGTARKDGLRCLECTIFRRDGLSVLASGLIKAAVAALDLPEVRAALHWDLMGPLTDGLITGVGSAQTAARRSRHRAPGECFRRAGWVEFPKRGGKADVWLCHPPPAAP